LSVPQVAVVGSYATGLTMKADRLPGRGETLLGTGYRVDFGGKGSNQAIGCARLGANVSFVAKIGNDSFGDGALGLYRDERIDTTHVHRTSAAPTGVGFITVEASTGHNCIVLDAGANALLNADDVTAAGSVLKSAAVVLTQLEIPVETAYAAMAQGRAHGAITILNPAPARPVPASLLQLADILTPNETEAAVLAGHLGNCGGTPEEIARELIKQGVKTVIVTLGEKGALIVDATSSTHVPAIEVSAVDTTGAGDAFNAGLAAALAFRASLQDAVQFAVISGGLAVIREGVVPALPTRAEVAQFYQRQGRTPPQWLGSHLQANRAI
jgi:ribokinase